MQHYFGRQGANTMLHIDTLPEKLELALQELAKGNGIAKTARLVGLGTGTVHKLKREMIAADRA